MQIRVGYERVFDYPQPSWCGRKRRTSGSCRLPGSPRRRMNPDIRDRCTIHFLTAHTACTREGSQLQQICQGEFLHEASPIHFHGPMADA